MIKRLDTGALEITERVRCGLETDVYVNGYVFTSKDQMDAAGVGRMFSSGFGSALGWIPSTDEFFQSCAKNVYKAVNFCVRQYAGNPHLLPDSVDITLLYMHH